MPPDARKMSSPLAYIFSFTYQMALPGKMADNHPEKAQPRYKTNYLKHVPYELHFAAGDRFFIELPPLMMSAAA